MSSVNICRCKGWDEMVAINLSGFFYCCYAALPARACVNELIINPTWNRFYLGGLEQA